MSWTQRAMLLILLTIALDAVGIGVILPIAPFYATAFGASALEVGLLFTAFSAAQFLATPVLGALSDRYGRRPVLLVSLLGEAAGYLLMGVAPNLAVLFLARIASGATSGNIGAAQAYIADLTPPSERTRSFGLMGAAFATGFLIGPALGGTLSQLDMHAPAFAATGLVLLNLILVYFWLPESLDPIQRRRPSLRAQLNPLGPVVDVFSRAALRPAVIATFLVASAFAGLQTNLAVFLAHRFSWGPTEVASVFVVWAGASVAVQLGVLGRLSARYGDLRLLVMGFALNSVASLLIGLAAGPHALWVAVVVLAASGAIWRPALAALTSKLTSAREQGLVSGGLQAITALGSVVGPIAAGLAFEYLGDAAPYVESGALTALAALFMLFAGSQAKPVAQFTGEVTLRRSSALS